MTGAQLRSVEVDGLSISYREAGSGPDLVLLHGFLSNSRCWSRQVASLKNCFRVVAWDAPGAGSSADPPDTFTTASYSHALARFLERSRDRTRAHRRLVLGRDPGTGVLSSLPDGCGRWSWPTPMPAGEAPSQPRRGKNGSRPAFGMRRDHLEPLPPSSCQASSQRGAAAPARRVLCHRLRFPPGRLPPYVVVIGRDRHAGPTTAHRRGYAPPVGQRGSSQSPSRRGANSCGDPWRGACRDPQGRAPEQHGATRGLRWPRSGFLPSHTGGGVYTARHHHRQRSALGQAIVSALRQRQPVMDVLL